MLFVLAQMSLLIACGTLWRSYAPQHIPTSSHRRALTDLVFHILLPAMVLDVIWRASLDSSSLQISFLAVCGLITGVSLMWLIARLLKTTKKQTGALLLAATFPNATYLGLPVLDQVLGPWSNSMVLQYDLFACTPILLSLGILLARHYGSQTVEMHPLKELLKVPPLWAVAIAITLNFTGVDQPELIHSGLSVLAGGVVPLMLIALGMSIRWDALRINLLHLLLPVMLITLFVVPTSVYLVSQLMSLNEPFATASVLIAAMPTMIFGIIICERYQLDSELYAAAVTLTTVCSLATLPIWFHWLTMG
ncbi:MAG: AEC family transporter [Proteobacteria bacterium]|nr:AEC family transporter [Pseudomonadota bacterium]